MNPMEYGHYNDENLKKALRASEDALDQARTEKRRWQAELAKQVTSDILDRIEHNASRSDLKCNSGNMREANQFEVSWLLTNLINAVQEADRQIPAS